MRIRMKVFASLLVFSTMSAVAVPKTHVITFGKWTAAKWDVGSADGKSLERKVRALYVDTRLKEFTTGPAHEVTDRLFVVRRVFRLNDTLPDETAATPRWVWQRGGWLLVDRVTGHVTPVNLPEFNPFYSTPSSAPAWQRRPMRVSFAPDENLKLTFSVKGQVVDVVLDSDDNDEGE
jgi:hypothetical protein